jgi:Mn-dependent DtxR family transcriptional regulator
MESDQRVIIRFLCKERVSPEDILTRLEAQFGDPTSCPRSARGWCQYARQGREDLHDEVRSGRPPIDFLEIRILALLDEQHFQSAYSIAEALGVSYSTVLSHLRESLGTKVFVYVGSCAS